MRLMIDTNIFIDVLAEREPSYTNSKDVLKLCEDKTVQGFLSASSITDIFYLIRHLLGNTDQAYKALGYILDIAKVLTVTNEDVLKAYIQKAANSALLFAAFPMAMRIHHMILFCKNASLP